MPTLARNQASNCGNPELDIFFRIGGVPTNVERLEFQIFEMVTNPAAPVQVYPASGRQAVNLEDCPVGGRITTGRYAADWTVPAAEPVGNHLIRWFFQVTPEAPEQSFSEEFTVTMGASASSSHGYTTVAALREEGVTPAMASDARLLTLIDRVSTMIDNYTGRFFEPQNRTYRLDGRGRQVQLINDPIISIEHVRILNADPYPGITQTLQPDQLIIYNRHLTENLRSPDDRDNPRIEFFYADTRYPGAWSNQPLVSSLMNLTRFPIGVQNIEVEGVFGYTDYDGTPLGKTPDLISYAAMLMVIRQLPLLAADEDRFDIRNRNRITKFKTRDQEVSYAAPSAVRPAHQAGGMFTGDPEIDNILASFMRPPALGAV